MSAIYLIKSSRGLIKLISRKVYHRTNNFFVSIFINYNWFYKQFQILIAIQISGISLWEAQMYFGKG